MNNNYIAVYGSLREGQYNYERFKNHFEEGLEYIETTTILGFDLFDLGSYPGIRYSDNPNQELTVDILCCNSECATLINRMELGANYYEEKIKVDVIECSIYIYDGFTFNLVESGNWSEYLKAKKFNL